MRGEQTGKNGIAPAAADWPALESLGSVLESVPNAIVLVNRQGRIALVNSQTETTFGYSREELIGQPIEILVPARFRSQHIAQREGFLASPSVRALGSDRDLLALRKDGREIPVEIGLNPIQAREGPFVLASVVEITRRKEAEQARHLAAIVEFSNDAIISKTLEGMVLSWNKAAERLFGYTADEVMGKPITFLLSADRLDEEELIIARLTRGESLDHFETVRQRRDGRSVHVSLQISPIRNDRGEVVGVSKTVRDITERKLAEELLKKTGERLEATNKELEAFSYSVSHDLRAPLRAINGFARVLDEDYGDRLDDEGRRVLALISTNASMMHQLIDGLLGFARLSRRAVEPKRVDMAELALATFQEARSAEPERSIDFRLATLPVVFGDSAMLRQVWVNLLSNAIKYTRPRTNAVIEVKGMVQGEEALFSVQDNGVGYDTRYAHKLFGVFQRLHDDSEFEGTGVGLALVRRIVERHGGRVWASSVLGQGSVFEFALPTQEEARARE